MKFIKLYEDMDWEFDDEEEPDYNLNYNIGDSITLKSMNNMFNVWVGNRWVCVNPSMLIDRPFKRIVAHIKHSNDINPHPTNYNGYMILVSGTTDYLWFKSDDLKKIE